MSLRSSFPLMLAVAACGSPSAVAPATPSNQASPAPGSAIASAEAASSSPASGAAPGGAANSAAESGSPPAPATEWTAKTFDLPGAHGPVTLDYLVYDKSRARVWIPVGDTGSADVFDIGSNAFTRVDGFKTEEREVRGKKRMMGPSAATVGDGVVYIGNRATSEVCAVDATSLKLGLCLKLKAPTDGVAYVASAKEVWVTTPRDQSITVLDASKPDALKPKKVIKTAGEPEGFAVDNGRGLFYSNLEDKNRTLVIDIKTHAVQATWATGCSDDGPRGVAVDAGRNFVFVACTGSIQVLDGNHNGAILGSLETGAGVDNIDYVDAAKLLYAAAGKAGRLSVVRVDDKGRPSLVAAAATSDGARNAVADGDGNVYVVDPQRARLLRFQAPPSPR